MKRPASTMEDVCVSEGVQDGVEDDQASLLAASTQELPGLSTDVCLTYKGLNVRPPYAQMLIHGIKTVEVRKYRVNERGMSPVMFLVKTKETPQDSTEVLGVLEFDVEGLKEYHTMESFRADFAHHRVDDQHLEVASGRFWNFARPLYGWPVKNVVPFEEPIVVDPSLPKRSILGWLKPVSLTAKLMPDELALMENIRTRHQC